MPRLPLTTGRLSEAKTAVLDLAPATAIELHDEGQAHSERWLVAAVNSVWPSTILSSGTFFNME